MKNYYILLKIDPDLNEKDLELKLINDAYRCNMIIDNSSDEEKKAKCKKRLAVIDEFKSILSNYGSKANYDKALKISDKFVNFKKKVKVGKKNNRRFVVFAGAVILTGVLTAYGVRTINKNLVTTEIPVYPGDSESSIAQEYDINEFQIKNNNFGNVYYNDLDEIEIIHKKSDTDRINSITEERIISHNPNLYHFRYIIKQGDTISELEERFEATKIDCNNRNIIIPGEEIVVYTENCDIAFSGDNEYRIETAKPVMSEWIDYVVQKDDTVSKIAKKYGVNEQDLLNYNSNIPNIHEIIEGSKIRIPTKILVGQDAIDYMNSSSKTIKK